MILKKISAAQSRKRRREAARQYESYIEYTLEAVRKEWVQLETHKYTLVQTFDSYIGVKLDSLSQDLSREHIQSSVQALRRLLNKATRDNNLALFERVYEEMKHLDLEKALSLPLFAKIASLNETQKKYLRRELG